MKDRIRTVLYHLPEGRFKVEVLYPIKDPEVAELLGKKYQVHETKIFDSQREAEIYEQEWFDVSQLD